MTMSTLSHGAIDTSAGRPRPASPRSFLRRRLPAAALGGLGAAAVLLAVRLTWVSTFNGLLKQEGWGTPNGTFLAAGAVTAGLLALASLAVASRTLRWLLALTGLGLAGFSGYLLIQLYQAFAQLDAMSFASKGPGLYVAAGGALAVFATVFLPMPERRDVDRPAAPSDAQAANIQRIGSVLRYPTAALTLVAGLAHVPVTPEHLVEAKYIGILFMCLTVACVLGATALLVADTALVYAGVGGVCALAAIAYVLSRTVGLPLMADDVGNWLETLGVVSVLTEIGAAGLSVIVLRRRSTAPSRAAAGA